MASVAAMTSKSNFTIILTNGSRNRTHYGYGYGYDQYNLELLGKIMGMIMPPCLVIAGVILNVLVIVPLYGKPFRKSSVFVILRAYVWSCISALVIETALQWILAMAGVSYIADWTDEVCRVWMFFINVVSHVPAWLVVAMVIDRYIHTMHPSRAINVCNTLTATVTVVFVCIGLGAISIHAMWTFEVTEDRQQCGVAPSGSGQMDSLTWSLMTDSFFYFIPQIFIFVFTALILIACCLHGCYRSVAMRDGTVSNRESTIIVMVVATTYFIFLLPCFVIKIKIILTITANSNPDVIYFLFEMLSQMALISSRAVSPFMILCSSPACRRELRERFCKIVTLCRRKNSESDSCKGDYKLTENGDENHTSITRV